MSTHEKLERARQSCVDFGKNLLNEAAEAVLWGLITVQRYTAGVDSAFGRCGGCELGTGRQRGGNLLPERRNGEERFRIDVANLSQSAIR